MLTEKSLKNLEGVHPDLVKVAKRAAELALQAGLEFQITEGLRSVERQKELVRKHASSTMRSRHLTGDAFDFVPVVDGEFCWKWPAFWPLVEIMEKAAGQCGVEIECGARWTRFPDGPHVQRPWGA